MKKFMEGVLQWKNYACMMFTGCVCAYGVIMLAMGREELKIGVLLQLLVLSALGTLIQGIAFYPDWLIKNVRYTVRMLIFVVPFLLLLTGFALVFHWFPMDNMINWAIFIGIFLAIFIILTAAFELTFHLTGKKYDGLLGQYKKKMEKNDEHGNLQE